MGELIITSRTRPQGETRTCRCGVEIVKIERVYGGFDLGAVFDVDVVTGDRHNPNCEGRR